ncbi:LUD domain-containing protein [Lewinella sp. JB7]|uniref:LutC/YkgG family protein n=1 Tax=Lewinella sp. JB7 TaxID=2962887 RepID=UPI0020C949BC|nr:lactate utilization protein [Lewinella sp. JB7]
MSSKSHILGRIRGNKPGPRALPTLPPDPAAGTREQWEPAFRAVLTGSKSGFITPDALSGHVAAYGPDATIVSTVPEVAGNLYLGTVTDPLQLAGVDVTVLRARLGVAENGAMWVSETEAVHRVLPFITQHLVLVVRTSDLVGTMHEAYRRIDVAETGFGVFIAGPSKTADIEQSLVIGAHGPRSLTVCLG